MLIFSKCEVIRIAAIALCAGSALLADTVVTFDDQPTASSGISGIALSNQYSSLGVTFSMIDASQSFKFNITPDSSPNYATPFFGAGNPGAIIFVDPADGVTEAYVNTASFTLLGLTSTTAHPGNFSGATIDALDLNGNVILGDSQTIGATSTSTADVTLTFTGQVHELRFTGTAGTSGLFPIDNLTFSTPAAVPEPSAWGLAVTVMLLAGWLGRRRLRCSAPIE